MSENTNKERLHALMADAIRTTGSDDAAFATFENHLEALRDARLLWSFIDPGVMRMLTRRLHGETKHSMTVAQVAVFSTSMKQSAPSSSTSSVDASAQSPSDAHRWYIGKASTETNAAGSAALKSADTLKGSSSVLPAATKTDGLAHGESSRNSFTGSAGASIPKRQDFTIRATGGRDAAYPRQVIFTKPVKAVAKQRTQDVIVTDNHGRNVKTMTKRSFATAVEDTAPHFIRFGQSVMNGMPESGRTQDRTSTFYTDADIKREWEGTAEK